ncbi:MAG: hypothetical protein RMJ07_00355 [Nitrososphaerota archaeon]|nr:hypothetical protein [Candidatus Bathyarchaeota archaeon]MDW8048125.1 hypothetical protein [Nitrososphaerota archaeon]
MRIEDFHQTLDEFEGMLQKIASDVAGRVAVEGSSLPEFWGEIEKSVQSLQNVALRLGDFMLTLKPERASTIKKQMSNLLQDIRDFVDSVKSAISSEDAKLDLEDLRSAIAGASEFLELAKEIKEHPSECISAILQLREVYDSKEFLSAIAIPEVAHARLMDLRKSIERLEVSLKAHERAIGDLRFSLNQAIGEISKFRPASPDEVPKFIPMSGEQKDKSQNFEHSLVRDNEES